MTQHRFALLCAALTATTVAAASPSLEDCNVPERWARTLVSAAPGAATTAEAHWLDRRHIRWPGAAAAGASYTLHTRDAAGAATVSMPLTPLPQPLNAPRFAFVAAGVDLQLPASAVVRLPALLRGVLTLVETAADGAPRRLTALQIAGALDDVYAAAAELPDLGVTLQRGQTRFRLWAPTADAVALCLYAGADAAAATLLPMQRDERTGAWSARVPRDLRGQYYTYLVDVHVRGQGLVRNRVTDPYSLSLNADSQRTWIGDLDDPHLQPPGWRDSNQRRPAPGKHNTDLVIYELHLRDFSADDASVPPAQRGRYGAFSQRTSRGMQHLATLQRAGVTDVHLLPVFDLATVPERGCSTPPADRLRAAAPDSPEQQALVMADAAQDCFNWGYDPFHFNAPEGSYASDANDGAVRIVEFRRMVQALHSMGLRVGMDVVYNHTTASGQNARSVLDRIVPGYYQRLDAQGKVETSTCCDNTATEHTMMAKLMVDSAVIWARDHRIDSFRFDLMGHQPRAAMERLQRAVDRAAGRRIQLIGEGWNFGEVADNKRFVQAAQHSLQGSGIASFSDRGRDAARGGGCCDDAQQTLQRQGWLNGLVHDANPHAGSVAPAELLLAADLLRVGLAGTLRDYRMTTADGSVKRLDAIDYAGQGAGFAAQPGEVVNYVENHDNPTLFDINVLKLPPGTAREDRARVQVLGLALTAFSQGVAYFHAGVEILRSKSGDRNSFDSGDWFNRIDWTLADNGFGSGLPPKKDNEVFWPALQPLLARAADIKPAPEQIAFTRDAFLDLLKIRASSSLFRLRTAADVQARLRFHNTGPAQQPTVLIGQLDGRGHAGAGFSELLYALNADKQPQRIELPALKGRSYRLHPVHLADNAADKRPRDQARWDAASGTLTVPPRSALVYVLR